LLHVTFANSQFLVFNLEETEGGQSNGNNAMSAEAKLNKEHGLKFNGMHVCHFMVVVTRILVFVTNFFSFVSL